MGDDFPIGRDWRSEVSHCLLTDLLLTLPPPISDLPSAPPLTSQVDPVAVVGGIGGNTPSNGSFALQQRHLTHIPNSNSIPWIGLSLLPASSISLSPPDPEDGPLFAAVPGRNRFAAFPLTLSYLIYIPTLIIECERENTKNRLSFFTQKRFTGLILDTF